MTKYIFYFILSFFIFSCTPKIAQRKPIQTLHNYSIAYNIHVPDTTKDDWEIMVMNADGSHKKNILQNDDVAWTYYAHNEKLYFISDRDSCYRCFYLYSCNKEGKNLKKMSHLQLEDSWMSSRNNGKEMIVSGRIGSKVRFQLFTINLETGEYKQLTNYQNAMFRDPCYSPDGTQIVCSYKKNKNDKSSHEELYLMDAEGNHLKQLTKYPEENISAKEYGYKAGSARWHPTENFISFVSKQDKKHSIFAISLDRKEHWKLIDNPESEGWHDWSPDGNWIVYNNSDVKESQFFITLMNWKTKQKQQLTDNSFKSQLCPVFIK